MTPAITDHRRARAVRFDRFGGPEVLEVRDLTQPRPEGDEVLVMMRAASINPGEAMIRAGDLREVFPTTFPSGEGTDLAGLVVANGDHAARFRPGDAVLGYSWTRSSHATLVVVPERQLIEKPKEVTWEVAGSLGVAGPTAIAAVRRVAVRPGEVVAVSGATGGVGALVTQLLVRQGATVLGIASASNGSWLTAHGAVPVPYGPELSERLLVAAGGHVDAFADLHGPEYLRLARDLGVRPGRIMTIVASGAARSLGIPVTGAAAIADDEVPHVLQELIELLATGRLELPIAATYPLDRVTEAFERLERRHTLGKIVLVP